MSATDTVCLGDSYLLYTKGNVIGRGAFGLVLKGLRRNNPGGQSSDQPIAIKEIYLRPDDMKRLEGHLNGKAILRRWKSLLDLRHPNILCYYQINIKNSPNGSTVNVAMEFVADGDLAGLIAQVRNKEVHLTDNVLLRMTEQLTFGLEYLHKNNIIHGDLKPGNILKKRCPVRRWRLIIADLDDRIHMEENVTKSLDITHLRGTARYMSPEMVARFVKQGHEKPGRKSDIWSLGCIILDLVNCSYGILQQNVLEKTFLERSSLWKKPSISKHLFTIWSDTTPEQIIFKIADGYIPVISSHIPDFMANIIKLCLTTDATERTGAGALLSTVRHLVHQNVLTGGALLRFHEIYVGNADPHAKSGDPAMVWAWVPGSDVIAIKKADHILAKNLRNGTEKRMNLPEVPKPSENNWDYTRRDCFQLSFNKTGNFVCVGFCTDLPLTYVLEMWLWPDDSSELVIIDSITTKAVTEYRVSLWNDAGTCFGAYLGCTDVKKKSGLYVWTANNMKFVEVTISTPVRLMEWEFVDEYMIHIYDDNEDCYVWIASISSTALLKRTNYSAKELPSPPVRHSAYVKPNSANVPWRSAYVKPDFERCAMFFREGDFIAEIHIDNTMTQNTVFRVRNRQKGIVHSEASLGWPYARASENCRKQKDVICFSLALHNSKNARTEQLYHLWMWHERKISPVLLSTELAYGDWMSISPDSRKISAIIQTARDEYNTPVTALLIWDIDSEEILWIISNRAAGVFYPLTVPSWNPGGSPIALTAWGAYVGETSRVINLLVLDLDRLPQIPM